MSQPQLCTGVGIPAFLKPIAVLAQIEDRLLGGGELPSQKDWDS